jgi:serine protease Do
VRTVDPQSDVALLQIEGATKLPVVKLGDSSHVRVGEPVLTIGSLDGAGNTATAGIVSATPRTLPDGTPFPFFQTDIAVNPDNSGGPLFNRAGEVIGVDVQIHADTDRYRSLTFAIPISAAIKLRAQSQAQAQAKGSRVGLGLEVQDVSPGLAAAFGLPRPAGALVNSVEPGARGAALALKPGDVITQIGDKTIDHSADLINYVARLRPGTKVPLKLVRNRKPMTMMVAVGAPEEKPAARQPGLKAIDAVDRLGLVVHPLSESERHSSGLGGGLMVDGSSGPAESAGIQPGDIVLSVNDTLVMSREELGSSLAKAGKEIALLIQRDNVRMFVSVEVK